MSQRWVLGGSTAGSCGQGRRWTARQASAWNRILFYMETPSTACTVFIDTEFSKSSASVKTWGKPCLVLLGTVPLFSALKMHVTHSSVVPLFPPPGQWPSLSASCVAAPAVGTYITCSVMLFGVNVPEHLHIKTHCFITNCFYFISSLYQR